MLYAVLIGIYLGCPGKVDFTPRDMVEPGINLVYDIAISRNKCNALSLSVYSKEQHSTELNRAQNSR